jgi:hypothetical protein
MRCPSCHLTIDPRTAWNSNNCFYCSEFCADSEISTVYGAAAAASAFFSGLKIEPRKSTPHGFIPVKPLVGVRSLLGGGKRIDRVVSISPCCDHCRGKLRFGVHRYWHMRFCSAACMNAYQQRLSPDTQQKIYEIDGITGRGTQHATTGQI